ncbi:MAG: GntR family transcriptional regulator [Victivallales bacterium]|nr:GntR family transcriptional regulator [Victivallales bacterium]
MLEKISSDSYMPKYEQLKQILRQKIKNREYKLGHAIPSERQMPGIFNVSKHTVVRAVTDLVQEGILYKEQGRGTFVKKTISKKEKKNSAKIISFIVQNINDFLISEICRGVEDAAKEKGYRVIVSNSGCSIEKETENIRMLDDTNASGAIIYPFSRNDNAEEISKLKQHNYPFVLIDRFFSDIKTDYVVVDNVKGGFLAVKHLTDLGHKRIGFIACMEASTVAGRLDGYRQALAQAGITYDKSLIVDIPHNVALKNMGREIDECGWHGEIEYLLNLKDKPTAVFCVNDYIAIGVIKRIEELGLRVPEDIAIVGFDDLPISSMIGVPLTTVSQPKYEIGKAAGEILIDKIEGKSPAELKEIVLDVELVIRDSASKC